MTIRSLSFQMALFSLVLLGLVWPLAAIETMTVFAGQELRPFVLRHGYLHGFSIGSLDTNRVAALKPRHWRLAHEFTFQEARRHGASVTWILSDGYANAVGGYPNAKPWLNWTGYENFLRAYLQNIRSQFPNDPVAFYDIWNEPDHPFFWSGTYQQTLELFARTYNVVKEFDADARLVGPSISWFRPNNPGVENVTGFLADLDSQYGIRLDAVAWHENGGAFHGGPKPEDILTNTEIVRARLEQNFGTGYAPELHINEYTGTQEHLSPGWNVGYLYYIDLADIDASMRSCWTVLERSGQTEVTYSGCGFGMDGMFLQNGRTPQPAYWVYQRYAEMDGGTQLATASSRIRSNILATRHEGERTLRLLVGRHFHTSSDTVQIKIEDYPFAGEEAFVRLEKIPHFPEFYDPLPEVRGLLNGPEVVSDQIVPVVDGCVSISIPAFGDGEAYAITVESAIARRFEVPTLSRGGWLLLVGATMFVGAITLRRHR